jgi:hypothetical protein
LNVACCETPPGTIGIEVVKEGQTAEEEERAERYMALILRTKNVVYEGNRTFTHHAASCPKMLYHKSGRFPIKESRKQ